MTASNPIRFGESGGKRSATEGHVGTTGCGHDVSTGGGSDTGALNMPRLCVFGEQITIDEQTEESKADENSNGRAKLRKYCERGFRGSDVWGGYI